MTGKITKNPDGSYLFTASNAFQCQRGGYLQSLQLYYEAFGERNADGSNVILIHHALSTGAHVTASDKRPDPGWWQAIVGPGKAIDTEHYYVICINNLGSCFGSSGPNSIDPQTNTRFNCDFPEITIKDMVDSQYLLLQALGIDNLYAIIGNSVGAMLSLQWAIDYPLTVQRLLLTSSCYKAYPHNIAMRAIQREIIQLDPAWQQGCYTTSNLGGFKLARKIGLLSYRNRAELDERFASETIESSHEIENYLRYNADKFVEQFDANTYLYLLRAMDLFDVTIGYQSTTAVFTRVAANTIVIAVDSDLLYPPEQQYTLHHHLQQAGTNVQLIEHHSSYGHDAFLVETDAFAGYVTQLLEN